MQKNERKGHVSPQILLVKCLVSSHAWLFILKLKCTEIGPSQKF